MYIKKAGQDFHLEDVKENIQALAEGSQNL
jgi:hypothetical protein